MDIDNDSSSSSSANSNFSANSNTDLSSHAEQNFLQRCTEAFHYMSWSDQEKGLFMRCVETAIAGKGTRADFLDGFQTEFMNSVKNIQSPNLIMQLLKGIFMGEAGGPSTSQLPRGLFKRKYEALVQQLEEILPNEEDMHRNKIGSLKDVIDKFDPSPRKLHKNFPWEENPEL